MHTSKIRIALCALALVPFLSCRTEIAGTSSESITGTSAFVYLPNGEPAAGAKVSAFGISDTSREPRFVAYSGANGAYALKGIQAGVYNVWIEKDSLVTVLDSLQLSPNVPVTGKDTLRPGLSFSGIVGLEPNHNPQSVFVQLVGSAIHAGNTNVTLDGGFTLRGLAAGSYTLLLTSTEANYTPTYFPISLGRDGTQAPPATDTLRLIYTGIPVVRGLKGGYDSLSGLVKVSWDRIRYRDFEEYVVFRDSLPAKVFNNEPYATTKDTFFVDTLSAAVQDPGSPAGKRPADRQFKYRVAVRNNLWKTGDCYKSLDVRVPAPKPAFATATFAYLGLRSGETLRQLRQGDTIRVAAGVESPRKILALTWISARPGTPGRDTVLGSQSFPVPGLSAQDTLVLVLAKPWFTADSSFLNLQVEEEGGIEEIIPHVLHAGTDPIAGDPVALVAAYRFTGNLLDSSGNGNHGVAHGGGFVADRFGRPNSAYGFDGVGTNDYIEVTDPINLPSGDVPKSIAGWVQLGPKAAIGRTFYDCDLGGFGAPGYASTFLFGVNGGYDRFTVWGYGDMFDWHTDILPQPYVEPAWHHYAVTYDGLTTTLYIDGAAKAATTAFRWNTIPERIILGNNITREGHEMDGALDDVLIYKGCLSPAAVKKLAEDR